MLSISYHIPGIGFRYTSRLVAAKMRNGMSCSWSQAGHKSIHKSMISNGRVCIRTARATSPIFFFHSVWYASTVFALFACRFGVSWLEKNTIAYLLTPSIPENPSAFFSPLHVTLRIGSPIRVQRTQLVGNTNVEKLPVLAPFGELAPGLGLDDRMVKVEACKLGHT